MALFNLWNGRNSLILAAAARCCFWAVRPMTFCSLSTAISHREVHAMTFLCRISVKSHEIAVFASFYFIFEQKQSLRWLFSFLLLLKVIKRRFSWLFRNYFSQKVINLLFLPKNGPKIVCIGTFHDFSGHWKNKKSLNEKILFAFAFYFAFILRNRNTYGKIC